MLYANRMGQHYLSYFVCTVTLVAQRFTLNMRKGSNFDELLILGLTLKIWNYSSIAAVGLTLMSFTPVSYQHKRCRNQSNLGRNFSNKKRFQIAVQTGCTNF